MNIAFDSSARTFDLDGRMHVRCHISKAGVFPYLGSEIPGADKLGLEPSRVYYLLRPPDELEKAAPTFARMPILSRHVPVSADAPRQDLIVGAIGSDIEYNAPYLDADLAFWSATAIAAIESGQLKELSPAYHFKPVMTPGEYEGQRYDGIMTELLGNHLAQVETGRTGPDVVVADSNPFKRVSMDKMTKLGKALFVALCAASPKLAQDAGLPALVGEADKKSFDKAKVTASLVAMDAALTPENLGVVMDAIIALDAEKEEKPQAIGDEGDDEDEDDEKDEKRKKAMDAALNSFKRGLIEADEARRAVRPVVGDVIAQDTAAGIYGFALDHLKVDHKGIESVTALKRLFEVASTHTTPAPQIALDSAGAETMFPGLARFGRA